MFLEKPISCESMRCSQLKYIPHYIFIIHYFELGFINVNAFQNRKCLVSRWKHKVSEEVRDLPSIFQGNET